MQDELFLRQWNDTHEDFTADLHRTLKQLGRYQRTRDEAVAVIGTPYDSILDKRHLEPARHELSPAARASLRGLAANVITFGLWVTVMLIATPAPGLASTPDAVAFQANACVAAPVVA